MDNDLISAAEFGPGQGSAKAPVGGVPSPAGRPRQQHGFQGFSRNTNHETRNTVFTVHQPSDITIWSEPGPLQRFSRITKHETQTLPFGTEALQSFFLRIGRHIMRREDLFLMSRDD